MKSSLFIFYFVACAFAVISKNLCQSKIVKIYHCVFF